MTFGFKSEEEKVMEKIRQLEWEAEEKIKQIEEAKWKLEEKQRKPKEKEIEEPQV